MMPYIKIFLGNVLPKLRMWWTTTAMLTTMRILLLHVRFQIMNGSAFSWMTTMIPILRHFNPIKPLLEKSTSTYMVSICMRKELHGQKLPSTDLQG